MRLPKNMTMNNKKPFEGSRSIEGVDPQGCNKWVCAGSIVACAAACAGGPLACAACLGPAVGVCGGCF